jgi:release factor glutamine methyltransferase
VIPAATRTIAAARHALAEQFRQAGIDSADADARLLMAHALGIDGAALMANGERALSADEAKAIDALAVRRLKREPVARIFGGKEFWSLNFQVSPAVLVPRPETETVIEAALDFVVRGGLRMERLRVLDIGTGSGALLLALLSELPNAVGTGTDISVAALEVARANAEHNDVAGRCTFVACNIAAGLQGPFDLIVSNPPYVARGDIASLAPEVREYDPALALDGGTDGLDGYRAIAADARRLLAAGGRLIVELGMGQEPAVRALFTNAGLTVGAARDDLAGIPRALSVAATL